MKIDYLVQNKFFFKMSDPGPDIAENAFENEVI